MKGTPPHFRPMQLCPLTPAPEPQPPSLKVFSGPGTGLLVSERLINCPPQLAPPMMQMLMEVGMRAGECWRLWCPLRGGGC